jgi:hypothetical protein
LQSATDAGPIRYQSTSGRNLTQYREVKTAPEMGLCSIFKPLPRDGLRFAHAALFALNHERAPCRVDRLSLCPGKEILDSPANDLLAPEAQDIGRSTVQSDEPPLIAESGPWPHLLRLRGRVGSGELRGGSFDPCRSVREALRALLGWPRSASAMPAIRREPSPQLMSLSSSRLSSVGSNPPFTRARMTSFWLSLAQAAMSWATWLGTSALRLGTYKGVPRLSYRPLQHKIRCALLVLTILSRLW